MKISCTNIMVPGENLTEKANNLINCGFDGISVFEALEDWTDEKEQELLHLEANTGIHVCEFCFYGQDYGKLMHSDLEIAARSKQIYERAIAIGNQLGSVSEMEYQYAAQQPVPLFEPYLKMDAVQRARFCELYLSLSQQATGDSWLLLEPINRYESPYLNNIGDNAEIVEQLNVPHTGVLFDTFHVSIEEVDLCATFRKYAHLIRHVHLGDNNRLLPGKGNLPWPQFIATLTEMEYTGYVNLECAVIGDNVLTQLEKTAQFLRSLA